MARVYRRRRLAAGAALLAVLVALTAAVWEGGSSETPRGGEAAGAPPEQPRAELPGGGHEVLPAHRVVGFFGAPQNEALGILGIGTPQQAGQRLLDRVEDYQTEGRPVMPAFELVATIAAEAPGDDELYRYRQKPEVIRRYLHAAREVGALLILDIQPGRADFMDEVRAYEEFLVEPDVGLALDPEWKMGPGEIPGQAIGSVEAREVNEVARYVDGIVQRERLPQKLMIVHQFTEDMIRDRESLETPPGVALTVNIDGFGDPTVKREKYRQLTGGDGSDDGGTGRSTAAQEEEGGAASSGGGAGEAPRGPPGHIGFKLFFEEDTDLLSPKEVLSLKPPPDVIVYE
jgi:hypothetical protein